VFDLVLKQMDSSTNAQSSKQGGPSRQAGGHPQASHRTVRDSLPSYGSSKWCWQLVSRTNTPVSKQAGLMMF